MKPKHINFYLDIAERAAKESSATRLNVGCILVKGDNIISIGYNGTPPDWDNTCEKDGVTKPEVIHAEENTILKLAKTTGNADGSIAFCTHSCCFHCAKMLFRSGVKEFHYIHDYRDSDGIDFLTKAGVLVVQERVIENEIRNY